MSYFVATSTTEHDQDYLFVLLLLCCLPFQLLLWRRGNCGNLCYRQISFAGESFLVECCIHSLMYVFDVLQFALTTCLQRSWAPLPELGDDVAKLSRRFFFPVTLVVLAIMSEFYWSAYPFDNACGK